jgi:predicted DNA-binding mobile mystery protein A
MIMSNSLRLQQLNQKTALFGKIVSISKLNEGWIMTLRKTLGITLEQMGNKLGVTKQNVMLMEKRELEGNITLKSLKELGNAMDMQLVYGFVPKDGSIDAMIERKALELATKIVMRASQTMKLEDQENSKLRLQKAIAERTLQIKNEMPKLLWD